MFGDEFEAESTGLFAEPCLETLVVLQIVLCADALIIGLSGGEQVVDDAGEFVGDGGNGLRSSQLGAHASIVLAERRVATVQGLSGDAQRRGGPVLDHAGFNEKHLAPADAVVGTQAEPGKAEAFAKRERSGPISVNRVLAVRGFRPGTSVRSTPKMR